MTQITDKITEQVLRLANDPRTTSNEPGAWADAVVGEHPAPTPGQIAAIDKAKAEERANHERRLRSQERSDTDGFLSQWASGISANVERIRQRLLAQGGFELFPTLYDRETGARVHAKLIDGRYGPCWALCDADGNFTGEFYGDSRTRRAKLWKAGYVVLAGWHPARATIRGTGTGLSGNAWAAAVQCDFEDREGADL